MKIIVSTHQGVVLNEETEYILVHNSDGEFGILTNHIPVVTIIDNGFIKTTNQNATKYVSLCGAIFEFHNNEAVVLAQEATYSESLEEAKKILLDNRNKRIEYNKKESVDFTKTENDLRKHMKTANAGKL